VSSFEFDILKFFLLLYLNFNLFHCS